MNRSTQRHPKRRKCRSTAMIIASITMLTMGFLSPEAKGQKVYVSKGYGIVRMNLDGSGLENLEITGEIIADIALDTASAKMYLADDGGVLYANLNGTGRQWLVTIPEFATGVALDLSGQLIYWVESQSRVSKANLDGTGVETLVTIDTVPTGGLAIDIPAGKMFWIGGSAIWSANLNGSSAHEIIADVLISSYNYVKADPTEHKIYWTQSGMLRRANNDGSGAEDVVNAACPTGLAIDSVNRKVYWADGCQPSSKSLRRANLDGTNVQNLGVLGGALSVFAISLDLRQPGDFNGDGVRRMDDFAVFQRCFSGPGFAGLSNRCDLADFDTDDDIDLDDYKGFVLGG